MTEAQNAKRPMIVGRPALIMVDFQGGDGEYIPGQEGGVPTMSGPEDRRARWARARSLVTVARAAGVPVIFIQEVHRPDMIDFGRELDGDEDVHAIEGLKSTAIAAAEVSVTIRGWIGEKTPESMPSSRMPSTVRWA